MSEWAAIAGALADPAVWAVAASIEWPAARTRRHRLHDNDLPDPDPRELEHARLWQALARDGQEAAE